MAHFTFFNDVKASRPDWPGGQNFGLGLCFNKLPSAWSIWHRPGLSLVNLALKNVLFFTIQCKVILAVSISWLYHCNIHYKDVVKYSNEGQKFSYMLLALSTCVLIQNYLRVAGFVLGLDLVVLTLVSESWPLSRRFGLL